jgi:signal transduction histidine kinase
VGQGSEAWAELEVEDHGDGIAPDALPHVFERFYRGDASRSRETGGSGLGLAICKAMVDAAGGRIGIRSAVGQGTRVRVEFPLVTRASMRADEPAFFSVR